MSGTSIVVRKLKREDIRNGFLESLSNLFTTGLSTGEAEDIFAKIDGNPVYRIFVAELEGQIVGATTLLIEQKFLLKGAKFGYIEDMAVRKDFERRGIGMQLMKAALDEAREEGCCVVRLDCDDAHAPFYEKAGFKKKGHVHRMQITLRDLKL